MNTKLRTIIFAIAIFLTGCASTVSLATVEPTQTLHLVAKTPSQTPISAATATALPTFTPTFIPAGTLFPTPAEAISAENVKDLGRIARLGRGYLKDLAWSPDGKLIAAASSTGIQVYDAQTLIEKYWIETDYTVGAVDFSPDSTLLASGGDYAGIVRLWSAADGTRVTALKSEGAPGALRFSPKGDMLVTSMGQQVSLFRLADETLLRTLKYSGGVDFSPDGDYLAAGDAGSFVIVHLPDGKIVHFVKLDGETYENVVETIAYSPDGATLVTLQENGDLNLWNASDGSWIRLIGKKSKGLGRSKLHFLPDGKTLSINKWNEKTKTETINLLRVSDGVLLQEFPAGAYASVAFSPTGDELVIGTQDHYLWTQKLANKSASVVLPDSISPVGNLAFSPDGKLLAASSGWFREASSIRLWQLSNGKLEIRGGSHVRSLAFSPDGAVLASANDSDPHSYPSISNLRTSDGLILANTKEAADIICLAFSPDGTVLAASLQDGSVQIRHAKDLTLIRTLSYKNQSYEHVNSIAFSPDGTLLALGSADSMIRIWQVSDGRLLFSLKGHKKEILSLVFSPKEPLLASTALDGTVRLWSATEGKNLHTIYTGAIYSLAFSPDGKLLAGGGSLSSVNIWQMDGGKLLKMLKFSNTSNDIRSLAFSPDGKLLAAGSWDETVWLLGIPSP